MMGCFVCSIDSIHTKNFFFFDIPFFSFIIEIIELENRSTHHIAARTCVCMYVVYIPPFILSLFLFYLYSTYIH